MTGTDPSTLADAAGSRTNADVIVVAQYLNTSGHPGPTRTWTLARALARDGFRVTVIAGNRNYMDDTRPLVAREDVEGVAIRRVTSRVAFRRSLRARLANYVGYALLATVAGLRLRRADVVIGSIQPMPAGFAAWLVSRFHGAPLVLEVRDAWPESAVAFGILRNRIGIVALRAAAGLLYHRARHIVVISPGLADIVASYGVAPSRMTVLPNGFDSELFPADASRARATERERRGWADDFIVTYAGAHVRIAHLETLIEAAALLKVRQPRARFVLVGDGDLKQGLLRAAADKGLDNVEFVPAVPNDRLPALLAASDAGVMLLPAGRHWGIFLENKLFDYLGSGLPVIGAVQGTQAEILTTSDAGLVIEPSNPEALAEAVMWLEAHRAEARAMGVRGRDFVNTHYRRDTFVDRFVEIVRVAARHGGRHQRSR